VAKVQPDRCEAFLDRLRPDSHQKYAAAILQGIGPVRSAAELAQLAHALHVRGFTSDEFRALVASALEDAASRDGGLDDETIGLLEEWLAAYPPSPEISDRNYGKRDVPQPIVVARFSYGRMFGIPHRSQIASAIAKGLLARAQPNISKWLEIFRHEIPIDPTHAFWWQMLSHMASSLNEFTPESNHAIASLFCVHPFLIHDIQMLPFLGRFMPRLEPERVREWIEPLYESDDDMQRQAFGELVMLCNAWHNDVWSQLTIEQAIASGDAVVLTGIGFVASLSWAVPRIRVAASRVLTTLVSHASRASIAAVDYFLAGASDHPIDFETREILRAVLANDHAIGYLVEPMIELAEKNVGITPELSSEIATKVVDTVGRELKTDLRKMDISAALTTIAITLHRQSLFRGVGLAIFERLIELGVREADAALEILDRRPTRRLASYPRRHHYRRGRRIRRRS
jgi:hypothetical protein